ncbi:MAG: DUF1294 domain-containing protein [Candidatus Merdivicinus sp.]|jgi:uncharacterized membrane protein YsdA (DUF1294 family)
MKWILFYLLILSLLDFFLCGVDKYKARRNRWRIPEKTLLGLAALGGGWGLWLGMITFRHKTKHLSFQILAPLTAILWSIAVIVIALYREGLFQF